MWDYFVKNTDAPTDIDSITETVERVMEHLAEHTESDIDLSQCTPLNVSGEHLAAVLRVTSRFRKNIDGWDHALLCCEIALRRAGLEPRDSLYTLI